MLDNIATDGSEVTLKLYFNFRGVYRFYILLCYSDLKRVLVYYTQCKL